KLTALFLFYCSSELGFSTMCYSSDMDLLSGETKIAARNSAPERDTARHPLTTKQASQLFAELGVPRAPRSVQRFCEHGYLHCVRVKGAKGDQFFVSQQSVERYAEELRQIEAIASIGAEERHSASERDTARHSAPE